LAGFSEDEVEGNMDMDAASGDSRSQLHLE
jgi:hypothetical protein